MEVCVQGSVSAFTTKPNQANTPRRTANFHPSVWGDHFLKYATTDVKESFIAEEEMKHARLIEEIRNMLIGVPDKSSQKLDLIDTIQRLGLSYDFESEIEASLLNIYNSQHDVNDEDDNDLYLVALRFRLLRQNGHYISCDVFNKFKNSNGKFKESMVNNVKGMLSLYEASNFRVHGENILEEALMFTTIELESMMPNLCDSDATQVKRALDFPIQKSLTRLGVMGYIALYKEDESHNVALLNLAKLDFNRLQKIHQRELCEITKWWKELDCARKLPFARDRLVECYFWILAVYFEPHYGLARRFLTKVIAMTSIIDDLYDVYGTLEEITLFTDAIERWDIKAVTRLPSYMRLVYQFLLDVYNEMEEELAKKGISGRVSYAKQEMKKLARAYFQEACWMHNKFVPTFNEYMKVSLVTGAYMMLATTSMVGMGDSATKETFDWVTNDPLIVRAASRICRLMDDMAGHEIDKEKGLPTAVECYTKENGVSKKEAFDEFQKQVTNAWKDINQECLEPAAVSKPILERVMNLARFIYLFYKDEDGYTNAQIKSKELIASVLVDPVII